MKKIFLLTVLLFPLTILFGQTKTENKKGTTGMATGGYKPNRQETPPKTTVTYESRNYQNDCYKSFAFTVKNYGYNKDGKFYSWGVSVKNNYSKAVQLKYKLIVGNDNNQNGTLTYYIKPGETYSNDFGTAKAIIVNNNSDQYKIEVSEVCFEGQDCNKNGYVDCNGRLNVTNSNTVDSPNGNNNFGTETIPDVSQETLELVKKKMLASIQEIADYLIENTPGVKTDEIKTDQFGRKFNVFKSYKCTVKFKLNGCNGAFNDINITGPNSTYNDNAKRTLEQLSRKYIVSENNYCGSQPATILLSDE